MLCAIKKWCIPPLIDLLHRLEALRVTGNLTLTHMNQNESRKKDTNPDRVPSCNKCLNEEVPA